MRLNPKEAANIALKFVVSLVGDHVLMADVTPEEIEVDDDGRTWVITIGYNSGPLGKIGAGTRQYRIVYLDDANGEVKRMKIREVR